jgi:murein DD-endopeptidase MepM/ murein hydrolase activator NlpD
MHNLRQFSIHNSRNRIQLGIVHGALCILLYACASVNSPTPILVTRPSPGLDPTDFLNTRVPQVLTENAATLAAAPTETFTPTPKAAHSPTQTETPIPSPTVTQTPSPYPTLRLSNFPTPPASPEGDPHFYFGRPIGEGGNPFIASNYRYGSTENHRFETHHGVEFANVTGTPLVAVAAGTIYYAGDDLTQKFGPDPNFYGNLVVLQLAQPWGEHTVYALYGHMNEVLVQTGQTVNTGDLLGRVGSTGIARGPHLHLEVRLDKPESYWDTRDPELWLAPISGAGAVAVRVVNEHDQYLPGMRVGLKCSDGAYRYLDTYWDPGVNPDDVYGENAAMTDIPTGFCHFETTIAGKKVEATATVEEGQVTFVWLKPQ